MSTQTTRVADAENEHAETAYEAIRAINHLTINGKAIPAPEVYTLLGNLKCLGHHLDQVLRQLARALAVSLSVYAVYEDDGGNPEESVAYATDSMRAAADHAAQLGALLDAAQTDISRQGYHHPPTGGPTMTGPTAPAATGARSGRGRTATRVNRARAQSSTGVWSRDYTEPIQHLDTTGGPSLRALTRPGWKDHGVCTSIEPDLWFAEPGTHRSGRAANTCRDCPVRRLCLAFALVFREEFGVWGGLNEAQRRPLENRLLTGEPLGRVLAAGLAAGQDHTKRGAA